MKSKEVSKNGPNDFEGRAKVDIQKSTSLYGRLWFHFGHRVDIFSSQDILCQLGC